MSNWTKNGVPTTYEALLSVFLVHEENMPEDDREKCRAAKDAVMAVEGDGKSIMPQDNPAKQVWQMYFGSWMDANGVKFE